MTVKPCANCNGTGYVWNPKTQKNDKKCPAGCNKGKVNTKLI